MLVLEQSLIIKAEAKPGISVDPGGSGTAAKGQFTPRSAKLVGEPGRTVQTLTRRNVS